MLASDTLCKLLPLIFIVAALYASVGHGGASGYLAVLSLMGLEAAAFVPLILILNVLVASASFLNYRRPGAFRFRDLLPFILTSMPAAYVGGMVKIPAAIFNGVLAIALVFAAARLIMPKRIRGPKVLRRKSAETSLWVIGLPIGLVLGFVSGMIGIGGGIFLSPVLLFLGLTDMKGSAAMASAFIVLNSLAGLAGHLLSIASLYHSAPAIPILFIVVALSGGLIGSRWGATRRGPQILQWALACVLLFASFKLGSSLFL